MRMDALLSFVAGAVVPLALAAVFQQVPPRDSQPQTLPEVTQASRPRSDGSVVTVLGSDGVSRQMELGDYLTGVVLAEMPAGFEEEALKAQAVVARTYTQKQMERGKHEGAAVCMDSGCCQGYQSPEAYLSRGGTAEAVEKVCAAVENTDGQVLTYGGTLIDATYFSCSGGSTEDAVAVWGSDVPYLQAVESPGEEAAPRYSDEAVFSASEFAGRLGISAAGDPAAWFGPVTYTDGGGVEVMEIQGRAFRGTELRSLLGLRSTVMEFRVDGDTVRIATRGFGHRVGMSQYGAQAMALEGKDCLQILSHYYQGTEVVFWD